MESVNFQGIPCAKMKMSRLNWQHLILLFRIHTRTSSKFFYLNFNRSITVHTKENSIIFCETTRAPCIFVYQELWAQKVYYVQIVISFVRRAIFDSSRLDMNLNSFQDKCSFYRMLRISDSTIGKRIRPQLMTRKIIRSVYKELIRSIQFYSLG